MRHALKNNQTQDGQYVVSKSMFASLISRDYRLLWVGSLGSSFAMNMQIIARGWLVYAMTESPMKQ